MKFSLFFCALWPTLVAAGPFGGFETAHKLEKDHKYAEAIIALKDVSKSGQTDDVQGLAYFYAGVLAYKAGQFQEAKDDLSLALKKPLRLEDYAHYYLAMANLKLNDLQSAKAELGRITNTPAGKAFNFEANIQLALIAIQEKNWLRAEAQLRHMERRSRGNDRYPEVLYHLVEVYQHLHRPERICKWARKLYAKYPAQPLVSDWGIDLSQDKIAAQSVSCYASLKEQQSRIHHLQLAGFSDRARKEIDYLENHATAATKYLVDKTLAQFLVSEGDVQQALQIYLKYYDDENHQINYLLAVGGAAARAGELQVAISAYYHAYQLRPSGKIGREALFQAAFLSYRFQDYDGAGRKFEELIHRFPNSGLSRDARWHLAWIRYLKGDYQGAHQHLSELLNVRHRRRRRAVVDSDNDKIRYWMAMSLLRMGQVEKARAELENIAADKLSGYYAITAKYRLAKIKEETQKLARSTASLSESIPVPAPAPVSGQKIDSGQGTAPAQTAAATPPDVIKGQSAEESDESEESIQLQSADEPASDQASTDQDSDDHDEQADSAPEEKIQPTDFADPKLIARFDRVHDLVTVGMDEWVKWELQEIERRTRNPNYLKMLMSQYEENQAFYRSSFIAQTFFTTQRSQLGMDPSIRPLWEHTYPKAFLSVVGQNAKRFRVQSELIWGIMRAESQYREDVASPVGALGLMQMMPYTAKKVAALLGIASLEPKDLFTPEMNIQLGARYLRRLMDKFSSQIPLVAAGYNAGPHRVEEWLYSFGQLDMDEFIEHIPYVETRNYVKKVVRNYQIYRELYAKDKNPIAHMAEPIRVQVQSPPPHREVWETL